ncbi:protein of unknown function [Paraburkholderia dioscoreae]|uniref:Uncharacterized protein n=1 Tax=Paraburkholderia dioscoreae TaxID=2604047 RepID=A0A5Q4YUH4_9BURK|nr:protein of unknown function [Paraburkholderia dioscoreae]
MRRARRPRLRKGPGGVAAFVSQRAVVRGLSRVHAERHHEPVFAEPAFALPRIDVRRQFIDRGHAGCCVNGGHGAGLDRRSVVDGA